MFKDLFFVFESSMTTDMQSIQVLEDTKTLPSINV
jgi:hypothetical protein